MVCRSSNRMSRSEASDDTDEAKAGPTLQHGGKLPGQVVRILDAGVHAKTAGGREAVRRVACQEHVALQGRRVALQSATS